MTGYTLEQIFNLIDYPKKKAVPPRTAEILQRYQEGEDREAIRHLGSLKLTAETKSASRKLYLYKEPNGVMNLVLAEVSKEHEEVKGH